MPHKPISRTPHSKSCRGAALASVSQVCCMQVRLRLAAAKVKLQQLQSALAAEKSNFGSSNHTNAWHAPGWFLTSQQGTQPRAVAHNDIKAQGVYDSSMPGCSILAREPGHSYSHLTSQQLDCRLQDYSEDHPRMVSRCRQPIHFLQKKQQLAKT